MIDWWMVTTNSLWILGLSILLAAFSYLDWLAGETGRPRLALSKGPSFHLAWMTGLFLTCAGWGLAQATRWWEKAVWLLLALWFGWAMLRSLVAAYKRSKAGLNP